MKRFKIIRLAFIAVPVAVAALLFHFFDLSGITRAPAAAVNSIIADAGDALSYSVGGKSDARRKLAEADAERARLLIDLAQSRDAVRKLEARLETREIDFASATAGIVARVVVRDIGSWHKEVTVEAGARDGVSPGFAALTGDGLAGRVVSVTDSTASVLLVTGANSATSVSIKNRGTFGIARGDGSGMIRVDMLPTEAGISPGDRVTTSGYGGNYPEGLPVGSVARVAPAGKKLSPTVTVKPAVDMTNLYYLILAKL
ncbi:MAG: Cell shape-determining protein MreC precursor [bacterium ADurb.Bin236]|nr:MAG: Cell shape-determining protein MreC precursor [bacterium ADurb.Bin236]